MAPCGRRQGRTTLVDLPLTSFLRGHMFTLCGAARRLGARCMDFGDERAALASRTVKRLWAPQRRGHAVWAGRATTHAAADPDASCAIHRTGQGERMGPAEPRRNLYVRLITSPKTAYYSPTTIP